ncbi:hypothetical protein M758_2G151100 [Ceratodon purpureus]|nr:hypothetical protein M758_2G151100 [Ceratodon purpureus]
MKGSRSASRPQRQARSGVTYKESDDDDDEFVPNARLSSDVVGRRSSLRNSAVEQPQEELGIAKGKRTLTLKRARTTVEPPVSLAKEDVDVYAIPEASPREKSIPAPGHGLQFPQVYESAERVLNSHRRQNSAFECLLEVVSDASGDGEEEGGSSGQFPGAPKSTGRSGSKGEQEEETTSAAYGPELLAAYSAFERKLQAVKGAKEGLEGSNAVRRLVQSTDEENRLVQGMKDTVVIERDKEGQQDDKPSADEKKYVRRSEKVKSDNMPSADAKKERKNGEEDKQDVVPPIDEKKDSEIGEENKSYNMTSADEDGEGNADAEDFWNESSDTENNSSVIEKSDPPAPAEKPSQDLKTFAKNTNPAKSLPSTAGRVLVPAKSTSVPPLLPKKRPALWVGTKPFVPPGPQTLQTPTAHRRVVGLSRRHRPPPLHPYLLGS